MCFRNSVVLINLYMSLRLSFFFVFNTLEGDGTLNEKPDLSNLGKEV